MIRRISVFLALVVIFAIHSQAQVGNPLPPIVANHYERVSTHDELMQFVRTIESPSVFFQVSIEGKTSQDREIPMITITERHPSTDAPKLTTMVFCSQHGNEPSGKEAALIFARECAEGKHNDLFKHMNLLLLPTMNPDGNEAATRTNGNKADLNRSHLTLLQPESRALHDVFERIRPEVTLDVHEFGAGGREWEQAGYVRVMDEQFGAPTNLNVSPEIREDITNNLFPYLDAQLASQRIRFFNYTIMGGPGDTVRHSTTDINDGRQSFAILNTYSLILEGRNGGGFNTDLKRRVTNQHAAITSFLTYVAGNAENIAELVHTGRNRLPRDHDPVVLQMNHIHNGETLAVPVKNLATGKDSSVAMKFASSVKPLLFVKRPHGYIIPASNTALHSFLDRHHIVYTQLDSDMEYRVESAIIDGFDLKMVEGDSVFLPLVSRKEGTRFFHTGDLLITLDQLRSTMIVIALEPESMWGLVQYKEFASLLQSGKEYPVYRIL